MRYILLGFFCIIGFSVKADLRGQMVGLMRDMGYTSHVSGAGAFKDQAGGYITGGSLFARTPSKTITPFSLQMPSFNAGCGGIDIFTGSMSFISTDELVNMVKMIASNAGSVGFSLMMARLKPMVKGVLDKLQADLQDMNNMMINSCQTSQALVGGIAPVTRESSQMYCTSKGLGIKKFDDFAEARHKCSEASERKSVSDRPTDSGDAQQFKDILGDEYNLVWKALRENAYFRGDKQLAEYVMSLTGSIVSKIEAGTDVPRIKRLPSLAQDQGIIKSLMGVGDSATAGDVQIYNCGSDTEKCLDPFGKQTISVAKENTIYNKVLDSIQALNDHIYEDTEPPVALREFVNTTSVPILRILANNAAYKNDAQPILITEVAEIIAYDMLMRHITTMIDIVWQHISELRSVQVDDTAIKEFNEDLHRLRQIMNQERMAIYKRFQTVQALNEKTKMLEQNVYNRFAAKESGEH